MSKYFYKDYVLEIPDGVYEPREDTMLLSEVLEKEDLKNKHVLELGCGSGLLSIIAAKRGAQVTSVDVDKNAVETTMKNAARNNIKVSCFTSNLFSAVRGRFDLIIFNPPYLPEEVEKNNKTWAAGEKLEVIRGALQAVCAHLNPKGKFLIVVSTLTSIEKVMYLMKKNNLSSTVVAERSIPWEKLMVLECQQT